MKLNEYTEVYVDKLAIRKNIMKIGVLIKDMSGQPESLEVKLAVEFLIKRKAEFFHFQ